MFDETGKRRPTRRRSRLRMASSVWQCVNMWLLNNQSPFSAERSWVRDENGAEFWIVVVKGAFVVADDGRCVPDSKQPDVLRVPKFRGPPESSSLLHETDLIHTKRCTDVLVHGCAIAPKGLVARSLDVRLKVGGIDKTLRVLGDRVLVRRGLSGLCLSDPRPFTAMPLIWEKSFGGTDRTDADPARHGWEPRNPVGVGFAMHKQHLIDSLAPNIEDPRFPYRASGSGYPAGFGPIARHWMPRIKYAGTYGKEWERTRCPLLPSDFDRSFYQCAPEDQQVDGYLKGGEIVEMQNLSPEGYLRFRLPRVTLVMATLFHDGTHADHRPDIHTLNLHPNTRRFELVWHSALACHHRVNKLAVTQVLFKTRIDMSHGARADHVTQWRPNE